jgi:hypothetical protein
MWQKPKRRPELENGIDAVGKGLRDEVHFCPGHPLVGTCSHPYLAPALETASFHCVHISKPPKVVGVLIGHHRLRMLQTLLTAWARLARFGCIAVHATIPIPILAYHLSPDVCSRAVRKSLVNGLNGTLSLLSGPWASFTPKVIRWPHYALSRRSHCWRLTNARCPKRITSVWSCGTTNGTAETLL